MTYRISQNVENPDNMVETSILVQHIVEERGLPVFFIERGFRHMLLLEFVDEIPDLVKSLEGFKTDIEQDKKRRQIGFGVL